MDIIPLFKLINIYKSCPKFVVDGVVVVYDVSTAIAFKHNIIRTL